MSRPTRFEEFRYLGDKRKQIVYDLDIDDADAQEAIAELLASERFAAFAPDSLRLVDYSTAPGSMVRGGTPASGVDWRAV